MSDNYMPHLLKLVTISNKSLNYRYLKRKDNNY